MSSVAQKLITWFANNKIKANHDKCHILLSTPEISNIQIANFTIKSSEIKKLLGILPHIFIKGRQAAKLKKSGKITEKWRRSGAGWVILTFYNLCETLRSGSPSVMAIN